MKIVIIFFIILMSSNLIQISHQEVLVNETNNTPNNIESGKWQLYMCDDATCDFSNWFADFLFGVGIAGGILIWQRYVHVKRSSYFIGQIFDILYPKMHQISNILFKKSLNTTMHEIVYETHIDEINSDSIVYDCIFDVILDDISEAVSVVSELEPDTIDELFSDIISEEEFQEILLEFNEIKSMIPRLQNFLIAGGFSISGKIQEETQKLIDDLDFDFSSSSDHKNAIKFEIELVLENVLVILKRNKKQLKKELGRKLNHFTTLLKTDRENVSFKEEIFKIQNLWKMLNSISNKQYDYFVRP